MSQVLILGKIWHVRSRIAVKEAFERGEVLDEMLNLSILSRGAKGILLGKICDEMGGS